MKSLENLFPYKLIFFLLLFISSCKKIENNKNCSRIISLSPSLTQMSFKLGIGKNIIAVTKYDYRPEEVKKLTKIGGFLDIDIEKLVSLHPDLVLLTELHSSLRNQLKKLNISYLVLKSRSISEVYSSIDKLGEYCKKSEKARQLTKELKSKLRPRSCKITPKVLVALGRTLGSLKNLVVAGNGTYFDELIILSGGENAIKTGNASYPRVGVEELVALSPDIIIDIVENKTESNPWSIVPFKKSPRIVKVSNPQISSPGVHMGEILDVFYKIICNKKKN